MRSNSFWEHIPRSGIGRPQNRFRRACKESFFRGVGIQVHECRRREPFRRYRVLPVAGNEYLDEAKAAGQSPSFLFDEIKARIAKEPVKHRIVVKLAADGDTVDDATVRWPETRPQIDFGEIALTAIMPNNPSEQQRLIFDRFPEPMASRLQPTHCSSRAREHLLDDGPTAGEQAGRH